MEEKYGQAGRIWVMDRGMVSEDNLLFMRKRSALYLVGTPKSMLKRFEQKIIKEDWEEVQPGVEIKLCHATDNAAETFVLYRSHGRMEKERAILDRFVTRIETSFTKLSERAKEGKIGDRQKAERQIGRLLERNSRASSIFEVTIKKEKKGKTNT